jgi:hypothetical protein
LVLQKIAFLASLDWILALHIVTQIRYLGFSHLREEGSLDYDEGFVRLQIHVNFDTIINRQHWPPGPSNQAYLSSPHLEASPATTFRACSSPVPTPVKPQPAILSQNQSTPRCQSLITSGSDHPLVLEPHMALIEVGSWW